MPQKKATTKKPNVKKKPSTSAQTKISVGQKVLVAVGLLAGLGALAAGVGSFDYQQYRRQRLYNTQQQAYIKTAQTIQTKQTKQAYRRVYPGMLVKGSQSTLYYIASDFKRYPIPQKSVYDSWYAGKKVSIINITDSQLGKIPLGTSIRFKPGSRPVKVSTSPDVYTITKGGVLHKITDESLMVELFGPKWALKVTDLGPFMVNYTIGDPLDSLDSPFHPAKAIIQTPTIDHDLGLK